MPISLQNPLSGLKDIHLPQGVSFMPPAVGWYCLLILILLLPVIIRFLKFLLRETVKRRAYKELLEIEKSLDSGKSRAEILFDFSALLKRIALISYDRKTVAGLFGQDWVDFIIATNKQSLSEEAKFVLASGLYAPADFFSDNKKDWQKIFKELFNFGLEWIKINT